MSKDLYVYSGIEPGEKGAGNFVLFFLNKLKNNNIHFKLLYNQTPDGKFVKLVKKLGLITFFKTFFYKIIQIFPKSKIENVEVILFHPQSIGLDIVTNIIKKNKVYFYVLDNFLFCKKSYNYIQGNGPCISCLKDRNAHIEYKCNFFPNNYGQDQYDNFIYEIKKNLKNISFLTQNDNQSKLLVKNFGKDIIINEVGMLIDLPKIKTKASTIYKNYDFLYHNTLTEAKGLLYFIELASYLMDYSFVIPYSKQQVKKILPELKEYNNLEFLSVTWNTGLLHILENCKIVINPSLWSSPVEGALLKSIFYNGTVAVVDIEYSFQQELPNNVVIKLTKDIEESKEMLLDIINSKQKISQIKKISKTWYNEYIERSNHSLDLFILNEFEKKI